MKINVTQKDIDKARRLTEDNESMLIYACPVSLAAKRSFRTEYIISYTSSIIKGKSLPKKFYSLPDEASQFIMAFDKGEKVEPIKFEVEEQLKWKI